MKAQDNSKGWPEGWLVAAAAAVLAAVMARVVGEVGLFAAFMIAVFVFLVFGVLLGMFWGAPAAAPHGGHATQGHDAPAPGHGADHGHAPVGAAAPVAAAPVHIPPVVSPIAEEVAARAIAAEAVAPPHDPVPAPEAVATDDGMAYPPVAQALLVEPVPEPVPEPVAEGVRKPAGLAAPRGGVADRLQVIEGIGPVLEKLCHELGIWHFDQIAGWGPAEIAWMDGNLKGFKGRVSRDKWVGQAKLIGEVGVDEFLRRAKSNTY